VNCLKSVWRMQWGERWTGDRGQEPALSLGRLWSGLEHTWCFYEAMQYLDKHTKLFFPRKTWQCNFARSVKKMCKSREHFYHGAVLCFPNLRVHRTRSGILSNLNAQSLNVWKPPRGGVSGTTPGGREYRTGPRRVSFPKALTPSIDNLNFSFLFTSTGKIPQS
jgi:hypothetical protein